MTEAGEGEDGRMKSAIGIGALLTDGLGDTIRVSLTEDPEYELTPCGELAAVRGGWDLGSHMLTLAPPPPTSSTEEQAGSTIGVACLRATRTRTSHRLLLVK